MASLTNYYTFYLIDKFGVSIQHSQIFLFVFLVSTAVGTLVGGPIGDRYGRKPVIWVSILGTAPFSMLMPYTGLAMTVVLSFCVGFMLSSAFPAILLYSQGVASQQARTRFGTVFRVCLRHSRVASAVLGNFADSYGIETVYHACAYMPLLRTCGLLPSQLEKME